MIVESLGVLLPVLPGIPLSWLGLFLYALATGFERISIVTVIVFFLLTVFTMVLNFIAPMIDDKKYQASNLGMAGAFIGGIVGIIAFNIWGIILGPVIGAFKGELIARKNPSRPLAPHLAHLLVL